MSGKLFVSFNPDFFSRFHKWEVLSDAGSGRWLTTIWEKENPEGFKDSQAQYDAMIDFVNGCRFSDTEYHVFMDGMLTDL